MMNRTLQEINIAGKILEPHDLDYNRRRRFSQFVFYLYSLSPEIYLTFRSISSYFLCPAKNILWQYLVIEYNLCFSLNR